MENNCGLTAREQEVLGLLSEGYSPLGIKEKLVIALPTVKMHLHNIFGKINVNTMHQAVVWFYKNK